MEPLVHWRCVAAGRVQGVNYRARVVGAARRFGVAGSVENLADGTVLIDVQGPREVVEAFLEEIRGPAGMSDAETVRRVVELAVLPGLRGFDLRRS